MGDHDSALRHLRDALVLTEAAVDELIDRDWRLSDHAVRARVHLLHAIRTIEEQSSEG